MVLRQVASIENGFDEFQPGIGRTQAIRNFMLDATLRTGWINKEAIKA